MIRLNNIEILALWGTLFALLTASGLYTAPVHIANALYGALNGAMQCWFWPEHEAVLLTQVQEDPVTNHRALLILHASANHAVPDEAWNAVYGKLVQFARGESCSEVRAFSDVPRAIELLEQHGFNRHTMLRKAV